MNSHPTPPDRELLVAAVGTLGEEDLIFLNRLVIARLKELEQAKDTAQVAMFALADRVEFTTNECEVKQGFVVRLNKKSVSVRTALLRKSSLKRATPNPAVAMARPPSEDGPVL